MKNTNDKFRYRLLDIRERYDITQKRLAEILGTTEQSVRGWEHGNPIPGPVRLLIRMMLDHPKLFKFRQCQ
jgi:DNA-binding transcriptional regulator YiaG